MNKEIGERWVTALRSGEYKQGSGCLKDPVGEDFRYCCLGVLCDIAEKEGITEWQEAVLDDRGITIIHPRGYARDVTRERENGLLPLEVQEWSGIEVNHGGFKVAGVGISLAWLNDSYGFDFNKLADVIERYHLGNKSVEADLPPELFE